MLDFPIYINGKDQRRRKPKRCKADGCPERARCIGYCQKHAHRVRKYGDPSVILMYKSPPLYPYGQMPKTCTWADCDKQTFSRGLCHKHYGNQREWGSPDAPQRLQDCPVCGERRYYIDKGRGMCTKCGRRLGIGRRKNITHGNGYWNRDACLSAGRVWCERTGYAPRSMDWAVVGRRGDFPNNRVVYRWFGTWIAFVNELGVPQPPGTRRPRSTRTSVADCLSAGLTFVDEHGYLPTRRQWNRMGGSPVASVMTRRFGTWAAFKAELAAATGIAQK
jgi:hypothetical protein